MPEPNQVFSDLQTGSFIVTLRVEKEIGDAMPNQASYLSELDVILDGLCVTMQHLQADARDGLTAGTMVCIVVDNQPLGDFALESNAILLTSRALSVIAGKPIKLNKGQSIQFIFETSNSVKVIVEMLLAVTGTRGSNHKR